MIISQRLKTITECAIKCEFLVDVGTDHAYIPIFLVKNKIAKRAIACDISEGSVFKAEKNIQLYRYSDFIETRVGDGLSVIKESECPDQIIIAGMGGMLIIDILNNDRKVVSHAERIILQPQRDIDKVRRTIHSLGFKIIDEKMIFEAGKYYNVIVCEKGKDLAYNEEDYMFGKILLEREDELLKSQIHFETLKIINILKNMGEKISNGKQDEAFIKRYNELKLKKKLYVQGWNILHRE